MPDDLKIKLQTFIEAKRIAKCGMEDVGKKLSELIKERKKLKKKNQYDGKLDLMIELLSEELDKILEDSNIT
jgi:hypothetical protein